MRTTGLFITGLGENIAGVPADWIEPNNIRNVADFATQTPSGAGDILRASTFSWSDLPSDSTIVGLECQIGWFKDGTTIVLSNLDLYDGTGVNGNDQSNSEIPPTTVLEILSIGGSTNDWGNDLTITEINSTGFGISITMTQSAGTPTVSIAFVIMAVWYNATNAHRGRLLHRSTLRGRLGS